jgi:hypothetical protein
MSTNYVPPFERMGTRPGNTQLGGGGMGRNGDLVNHVKIVGNAVDEDFQTGRTKAPVFTSEEPQSVNILIDSKSRQDRASQPNPFKFRASINSNMYRSRFGRVRKILVPKVPNINLNNNELWIYTRKATAPFYTKNIITIPVGYYDTITIANTISTLLTNEVDGGIYTYVCVLNATNKTFNISTPDAEGIFMISSNCSFIQYGSNMIPFQAYDEGNDPFQVLDDNGAYSVNSNMSCMLYTRYIFLASESFNSYAYAISRTSDIHIADDIIAIADISSTYFAEDWEVGRPFAGLCREVSTPEAPLISLRNPQRNLNSVADFYVLDEYGINLGKAFELGDGYPSESAAGIAFWLEITF